MKTIPKITAVGGLAAILASHGVAQEVPSTERYGIALLDPGGGGVAVRVPKPTAPKSGAGKTRVERTVTRVTGSGPAITWTREYRPSADDYRRDVARAMAAKQEFPTESTLTITTEIEGGETLRRTVTPGEEAVGRLFDPVDPALDERFDVWDFHELDGLGYPDLLDPEVGRRLLEQWDPVHGFGNGRNGG